MQILCLFSKSSLIKYRKCILLRTDKCKLAFVSVSKQLIKRMHCENNMEIEH